MIVQTAIVKTAIVLAATLNPDHPSTSPNNGNKGFRLPFLPPRQVNSAVSEMPALDIAASSKDCKFCVAPLNAAINIRGGEQVKKQSFLQKYPFWSGCGITTFKTFAADLLTQCVFEAKPWDPKRSAVFAAFGFFYQGRNSSASSFFLQQLII